MNEPKDELKELQERKDKAIPYLKDLDQLMRLVGMATYAVPLQILLKK